MTISVRDIGRDFAGVAALKTISFEAPPGEVTAVIGPNGAGKTTLINLMSGHLKPSRGEIFMHGKPVGSLSPHARARLGIARTFQRSRVFEDMTVIENMLLGQYARNGRRASRKSRLRLDAEAFTVLRDLGLEQVAHKNASDLSHGEQRRVEIARSLVAKPDVLLLDEPAAGLSADERAKLKHDLSSLVTDGLAVILVEHDLELVMSLAQTVVVVDFGTVIANGDPTSVVGDPAVQKAYMGSAS